MHFNVTVLNYFCMFVLLTNFARAFQIWKMFHCFSFLIHEFSFPRFREYAASMAIFTKALIRFPLNIALVFARANLCVESTINEFLGSTEASAPRLAEAADSYAYIISSCPSSSMEAKIALAKCQQVCDIYCITCCLYFARNQFPIFRMSSRIPTDHHNACHSKMLSRWSHCYSGEVLLLREKRDMRRHVQITNQRQYQSCFSESQLGRATLYCRKSESLIDTLNWE